MEREKWIFITVKCQDRSAASKIAFHQSNFQYLDPWGGPNPEPLFSFFPVPVNIFVAWSSFVMFGFQKNVLNSH